MALLALEGLHLNFGGVAALAGVSVDVAAGDLFAIIGPNGAGKTSIFNCISGIYTPTRGRIAFDGHDITHLPPHQRARLRIARTFQNIALFRRSEEHTSELQSHHDLVCRLLLEKKKNRRS